MKKAKLLIKICGEENWCQATIFQLKKNIDIIEYTSKRSFGKDYKV